MIWDISLGSSESDEFEWTSEVMTMMIPVCCLKLQGWVLTCCELCLCERLISCLEHEELTRCWKFCLLKMQTPTWGPYAQQCSLDNLFPTWGGHVRKAPLNPKRGSDWDANIHRMFYANKVKWKAWTHTQPNCMGIDPSFSTLICVAMRARSLDPASAYAFGNKSGLASKW